ncbi:2Fe-2S iron-sulfur cluster-binding protein [Vibrio sp. PNB22_3_1]
MCRVKPSEKSILEALELQGVSPPAECRNGYCGACSARLVSGDVEYIRDVLGYVPEGNILICSARAVSDVEIRLSGEPDG